MDRMIYLAMSGAQATLERQDVLSHNLANASTNGFRAEMQSFRSVPVQGSGASTRAFALETTVGYSSAPGTVQVTGGALDVALKGNAWLAVQGSDGTEAYTRAGQLQVSAQGQLVNVDGLPVLGNGGPITLPAGAMVEIAPNGIITTKVGNNKPQQSGRLKMVTPADPMTRGTDGLFRSADGNPLDADPKAQLQSGALEGSNVNPVETMVAMISAARQFEQQLKLLTNADQQDQSASKLLSTS